MKKPVIIVGFPIISKLIHGCSVELLRANLIPDDQLFNESLKSAKARKEELKSYVRRKP
jgi:hypothetical protein